MGVLVGGQVSKDWQTFVPGFADDVELLNDAKVKADKLLESLMSGDNDLTKTLQNKKVWNMAHCVMLDHALRVGFQTSMQKCCPAYPAQLLAANEYRYTATILVPLLHDDCCAQGSKTRSCIYNTSSGTSRLELAFEMRGGKLFAPDDPSARGPRTETMGRAKLRDRCLRHAGCGLSRRLPSLVGVHQVGHQQCEGQHVAHRAHRRLEPLSTSLGVACFPLQILLGGI